MPMTLVRESNNMTSRAIWRYQLSVNFSKTTKLHKSVRRVQFVAKNIYIKRRQNHEIISVSGTTISFMR